jgi:hypothetical protein
MMEGAFSGVDYGSGSGGFGSAFRFRGFMIARAI